MELLKQNKSSLRFGHLSNRKGNKKNKTMNIENFKSELIALLNKYNATIGCNIDGDTHGLSYEMVVTFGSADKWKEYKLSNNAEISAEDIK